MSRFFLVLCFISFFISSYAQVNFNYASRVIYDKTYDTDLIEDTTCANVWGWTNPLDGKEYALVGAEHGTSIVDVSNPFAPVQVQFVPGTMSLWKEIKTFQNYAYVVSEGSGHGLKIIDLQNLPLSVSVYTVNFSASNRCHALFIDETDGYLYMFGTNGFNGGGATIMDLNANPINPPIVGAWTAAYIHDGYVRNNILYAGCIFLGKMRMIDVTNKAAPVLIGEVTTPTAFTHNTWLNVAGDVCFTTDENAGSFVGAYDITDPTDIKEIDRVRDNTNGNGIVHNVHNNNDWLFASYYTNGVVVFDVHVPDIMVEVGNYDCNLAKSGNSFESVWGVYPYFNSGTVLATDIEQGLFVLQVNLVRASYLRGHVYDACGNPLIGANVKLIGTNDSTVSDINGAYKMGFNYDGNYQVMVSQSPYLTDTINVNLVRSETDTLDFNLQYAPQTISFGATNDSICSGGMSTLSIPGGTGFVYQWYKDGVLLAGATSSAYNAFLAGNYHCQFGLPSCLSSSNTATITVIPQPNPIISGGGATLCGGQQYTYTALASGGTIIWTVTGGTIISGQGTNMVVIEWDNGPSSGTLSVSHTLP